MRGVRHLAIAIALMRFYFRIVPRRWYRIAPFLPLPSRKYVRWRMETAYGNRRPSWRVVFGDLWQFGGWLADADSMGAHPEV